MIMIVRNLQLVLTNRRVGKQLLKIKSKNTIQLNQMRHVHKLMKTYHKLEEAQIPDKPIGERKIQSLKVKYKRKR